MSEPTHDWQSLKRQWAEIVRDLRLIAGAKLVSLLLTVLPWPERYEFAVFVGQSWIGRGARAERERVARQTA